MFFLYIILKVWFNFFLSHTNCTLELINFSMLNVMIKSVNFSWPKIAIMYEMGVVCGTYWFIVFILQMFRAPN